MGELNNTAELILWSIIHDWLIDQLKDWLTGLLSDSRMTNWQKTDWLSGLLRTDWLIDWVAYWGLTDWLIE